MEIKIKELKDHEEFDGYTIDEYGKVRSYYKRGMNRKYKGIFWDSEPTILKPSIKSSGYKHLGLHGENSRVYYQTIHRLVALAFIPNPNNLEQVNHIDGNKLNNDITNLEWVSRKKNISHSYQLGLSTRFKKGQYRPVLQYDLEGNFIRRYDFTSDAIKAIGLNKSSRASITRCCKGKQKTCGGYIWRYENIHDKGSTTMA